MRMRQLDHPRRSADVNPDNLYVSVVPLRIVTWKRVFLWLPPLALMALIFYLSSESEPIPAVTEHVWDKALHFSAYAVLGALFYRALRGEGCSVATAIVLAVAATSLYGATDEWHQSYVALRQSDYHDWVADTIGAVVGAGLSPFGVGRRNR
jgi:VanZ like family